VSSFICREENGEYICERDIDVELKKLKESVIRELLERIAEELEVEVEITEIGAGEFRGKGRFKKKERS
jgi:hypothetical protein